MNNLTKIALSLAGLSLTFSALADEDSLTTITWPMYQQNAAHTGFVPVDIHPKYFQFEWQVTIGDPATPGLNYSISPAVVAGNLVYVSRNNYMYSNTLQAFSITDGKVVWSKSYGSVMINPPTVYQNTVYVQTVNNASPDTALYGYDAATGNTLFKSPTAAQWEHYLAPTAYGNNIYVDGGTYGGMYSFNNSSGQQNWFTGLAQYDMWTPAVNAQYAVAYTGGQLNILDSTSGRLLGNIIDPHYQWSGYSTNFAPVFTDSQTALSVQSGYLTSYHLDSKSIAWSAGPGYVGQPSFDGQSIYAVQNDGLVVLDPATGNVKWKWFPNNQHVQGQLIVTANFVLLSTESRVYAISKWRQHNAIWSYPASGVLSMGRGHLYIVEHDSGNLISLKLS